MILVFFWWSCGAVNSGPFGYVLDDYKLVLFTVYFEILMRTNKNSIPHGYKAY